MDWTSKTPVFLPRHFKYRSSESTFSWKKVAKQEKNGLFALFLLYWLFEYMGKFVAEGVLALEQSWSLMGAIATGKIYFILKFLKNYTTVLNES